MIQMGIDLGTNYIRLCTQEDGLLYNEPCMYIMSHAWLRLMSKIMF